jgi:hypothetical protein
MMQIEIFAGIMIGCEVGNVEVLVTLKCTMQLSVKCMQLSVKMYHATLSSFSK